MDFASSASVATTHEVGGSVGWTMPEDLETYANWAAGFSFPTESCTTTAPIGGAILYTSPATLNLSTAGMHYYICGFPTHCAFDMKLSINSPSPSLAEAGRPTPAPTPSTGGGGPGLKWWWSHRW
ncbi:hypothetical protein QJS10_CPA10g00378 [Acorus calamus]|uniref:Phytocyanin domain-containing protein n=1 Tax=Acorus calamus TaxID=4465 RepID=A0AAV9DY41_ACOCL|nr:hypothetical protein QJS10_CPA10g00378 [Acorus calamus]